MTRFNYQLRRRPGLSSSVSLSIRPTGKIVVSAPKWMPVFMIDKFIEEKKEWLENKLAKFTSIPPVKTFNSGDTLLYFGNPITINLTITDTPRTSFEMSQDQFIILVGSHHSETARHQEIHKAMERWYLQQGIAIITEKVNHYSSLLGVTYSKITIKKVSSIWGSCSYQNNLSFSRKLIMAPHEIVDYVVIHECCHMIHRDHSSRFWGAVRQLDPSYKEHRFWLKENSHLLNF